jgi:hypothetical protein
MPRILYIPKSITNPADGSYVFCIENGKLFVRESGSWTDKGDVFEGTPSSGKTRLSGDFKYHFYACSVPMLSDDYGKYFDSTGLTSRNYSTAAISANDGKYIATVYSIGYLVKSTNYGVSFANDTEPGNLNWRTVKISATGQYWLLGGYNTKIWVSSDYGENWTEKDTARLYYGTFVSSTGQYQSIIVYQGTNYYSSNYGSTFSAATGLAANKWVEMDGSESGQYQYAVATATKKIYKSSDYGATWSELTNSYADSYEWINCSASGEYIIAGKSTKQYYSDDYGATWSDITKSGIVVAIGINRNAA